MQIYILFSDLQHLRRYFFRSARTAHRTRKRNILHANMIRKETARNFRQPLFHAFGFREHLSDIRFSKSRTRFAASVLVLRRGGKPVRGEGSRSPAVRAAAALFRPHACASRCRPTRPGESLPPAGERSSEVAHANCTADKPHAAGRPDGILRTTGSPEAALSPSREKVTCTARQRASPRLSLRSRELSPRRNRGYCATSCGRYCPAPPG